MMWLPRIMAENLFDDWCDTFRDVDRRLYGKRAAAEMKTDVREHEDHYELDVDLPGFKKDQITLSLENGYLTVSAAKGIEKDEQNEKGKVIRRERYAGSMQRSFYVGNDLTHEDVTARFEDGVLHLTVPKAENRKLPEKKTINIE